MLQLSAAASSMNDLSPVSQPFDKLLAALDAGWHIQPPVYYRQQWYTGQSHKLGFYFIVKRGNDTDLLIVPDGTYIAASLPSMSAIRSSSRLTVGSSANTSSPTSAAAIAARACPGTDAVPYSARCLEFIAIK